MKPRQRASPVSAADQVDKQQTAARLVDLGKSDYAAAYRLQQALVEKRRQATAAGDIFIVTEHPATFTLGRRGGLQNLMVSEQFLQDKNIPLVPIERGGDITYHGPGQLVIYPIIHLRQAGLTVAAYVHQLEQLMINLAAECGVAAERDLRNHGVWAGGRKLGSVGIAIRHGVAFHGLALNVDVCLEPFSWVNPCGLTGVRMTTLSRECGRAVALDEVKGALFDQLRAVFNRNLIPLDKDHPDVTMSERKKDGQTEMAQAQPADRAGI
ncbi:lipoyl(octanoyl) transferase LipB [Desulfopila sp. IMCC35006]|nr:lipoyl(octanoyl) transferase LipB [Desulfopila sp. IMCC35006]